jgi:HD-like signal output (HDOD) protein/GGDEF domain-containing protein
MSGAAITLDTLVLRARRLCSLPSVAMKVLELTANPQVDSYALKQCIENDPALTCKILRTVNSSLFGLSREVSDLNQALALLGTKPLKLLVLGFSLPAGLFSGMSAASLGRYWRRTLTKAVAAREISELIWKQPGDEAFIAGLLQDIGMLLLMQEIGPLYGEFLHKARQTGKELAALETEALGFDHTVLSARLLAHWGLPDTLLEAVAYRPEEDRARSGSRALPQIVHLAELVAQLLVDGQAGVLGTILRVGQHYREMTPEGFEVLVGRLEERVEQLASVLALELPGAAAYQDVLVRAQAQLAEVAADAVGDLLRQRYGAVSAGQDAALLEELDVIARSLGQQCGQSVRPIHLGAPHTVDQPARAALKRPASVAAGGEAELARAREAGSLGAKPSVEPETAEIEPGLLGRLEAAVAESRRKRCGLSLIFVELNQADKLVLTRGVEGFQRLLRQLELFCQELEHPSMRVIPSGEAGYALVLPDCDRRQAMQLGNQLISSVRRLADREKLDVEPALSIHVGAATVTLPPKNFPAHDLIESADRCLYGSRASGGNVMKSIEIF